MALRIVATTPDPALVTLPWHLPLEDWDGEFLVPLPRGLSRHIVRFVRLDEHIYAVKETREAIAWREYRLLRDLRRIKAPAVEPVGVITGRETAEGEEIEPCLLTRHLTASMPYREMFSRGPRPDTMPRLMDAIVVLLAKLHLAGFYWGDCSLSNTLFRRSAGEFAAYLVDAETGELHHELSDGQRRHDLDTARGNLFAEMLDLQAGGFLGEEVDALTLTDGVIERYRQLWDELTGPEDFDVDEMWRIERRIARLNELGFEVDELDIVTDWDGQSVRIQPKVVDAGHHRRRLQGLTGLDVEENQARRLLNDLNAFTAANALQNEDAALVAHRWLTQIVEPIVGMVPPTRKSPLEAAEVFHEILEHRWYLSEQAGSEVEIFDTARDYVRRQLKTEPLEASFGP
jgi:tRNA A-37 threonylcarbamoyl transferase component Bud32